MNNEQLLNNLFTLKTLKSSDREEFLDKWIYDTKTLLANESTATIGLGSGIKTMTNILKANDKINSPFSRLQTVRDHFKNEYILADDDGIMAILLKGHYDLPIAVKGSKYDAGTKATVLRNQIYYLRDKATEKVLLPTRAELNTLIKEHKAKRTKGVCTYSFGAGLPTVEAKKLFDMLAIFPGNVARVDRDCIYFEYAPVKGLLKGITQY